MSAKATAHPVTVSQLLVVDLLSALTAFTLLADSEKHRIAAHQETIVAAALLGLI